MKKIILVLFLLQTMFIQAQHKQLERVHELGFGLGGLNYTGDLAENLKLKYTKPSVNVFYRHNNRNEISDLRTNILIGQLGVDESTSKEPSRAARKDQFSGLLIELSELYEYNFFDFRDVNNKYYMSPFLYGGISVNQFIGSNYNAGFVGIPFGAGVKFRLKGGWNIGGELGARKNFTDALDNQEDEMLLNSAMLTDWHYHVGINMSYTFYKLICPRDVSKNVKYK